MKNSIKAGDWVESRFRAHWKGTVLFIDHGCSYVQQEIDRHGHPIRKPKIVCLGTSWLRKIERKASQA